MAGKHRTETSPPAVAVWLGTGAVALGIGAALTTGAAVAGADTGDTGGTKSSSQSGGASAGPAAKRTAPRSVATARTHQRPSPKADSIEDEGAVAVSAAARVSAASAAPSAASANPFDALEKAFRKAFLNTAPTITSSSGPTRDSEGNYTGQVVAADVDDDPLTYSVGIEPKRGTASVDAAGNYTYIPDAELAASGGTDAFYIHAVEANAGTHLHGFNEFTARLFDPLFRLLNSLVPQNPYQFPTYNAANYARAQHYVRVTIPPAT